MKTIENYQDVEIMGRKFRIKKFDARTGSYMLLKIMGLVTPLFRKVDFDKLKDVKDVNDVNIGAIDILGLVTELASLPEKEFNYIQEKCLRVCSELLAAGPTPVLNENGSFGVLGLEDDTMTVIALTAHTLIFNVKGFFSGSPLASMVGGLLTTSQQDS